ncbi:Uncharacterised conserved protein (DUF2366) [Nesidiocoris tenuis]|nr:Uncharacterised conserved protein (DUF2366) [Nesidiocoris tenuis]
MGAAVYLASNNPTEEDFRDAYLKSCNDFIFVAPAIRNPETDLHLKSIELFYNQDIVERISFGIFSIIWVKDYSSQVAAYKSLCKYLTPALGTYRARILDVGFLGRWWVLDEVMKDCDINRYEWAE